MKQAAVGRSFIQKTHCAESAKVSRRMTRIVAIAAAVFLLYLLGAAGTVSPAMAQGSSAQVLHNEDVIQMVHAKLSDEVIVAKIKSSPCKFDTSPDQLIKLKSAGASDEVLKARPECGMPAGTPAAAPPAVITPSMNSPDL